MEKPSEEVCRYWIAFDDHLKTLPITRADERERDALIAVTRSNYSGDYLPLTDPIKHATMAHRFRFVLGPTISDEEVEEARRQHMEDAADLLASGVGLRALGLRNWGGPLA